MIHSAMRDLPAALDYLSDTEPDGLPGGTEPGTRGGAQSTSVESAMAARHQWRRDADQLTNAYDALTSAAIHMARVSRRLASGTTDTAALAHLHRCTGGQGERGAEEWGNPHCDAIADKGGMCMGCAKRGQRWRRRRDEVA
jgi:hypothetical protein